jgi:hypothetical protein
MPMAKDMTALWLWPWTMARTGLALFETMAGAQTVVGARLPLIGASLQDPWSAAPGTAGHRELSRMVSEKTDAFGDSHRTIRVAAGKAQAAGEANLRDLARLASGALPGPADWMRSAERNLGAWTALALLPAAALAPVHRRVRANAARLGRPPA